MKKNTKSIEQILNALFYTVKDTIVHPDERNCQKNMPAKNTQEFS